MNFFLFPAKRQKRRLLNCHVPSAADCSGEMLERRILLTVPDPVIITNLELAPFNESTARLEWEVQDNVDNYEIWISQLGYGQIANFTVNGNQNNAITPVVYGDWHRVWVRGINEDGNGPWGPAFTAIVGDELPDQPVLSTWLDTDVYTTETTPDFTWSYTQRATQYDVWVQKTGQTQPYHRSVVDARRDGNTNRLNRWSSETDMEDGVYRVWVRGRNANGVSPWAASNYRAIGGEQPEITGTTDSGVALRPTITWTEGAQSVDYQLWVSSEATGQRVLLESNLTTNSFNPAVDLEVGIYRAWVRQTPVEGNALPWSPVGRFEVGQNTIPGTPSVTATSDPAGETYHSNLILSWDGVDNAGQYEIYLSETRSGEQAISQTIAESTFVVDLAILPNYGTFRAWVRAIGTDNTRGQWSEYRQFSVITFTDGRKRVAVAGE